jgi:anti-sigma regulatory factor (Ser/Thr protein kinase)
VRTEATFAGRLAAFAEVRAWAEAFGAAIGAERSAVLRLVLVLEELFTNTVVHGYGAGTEGPVWVALAGGDGGIEVTYEDAGPAFDPLAAAPGPRLEARMPAEAPPGGLGLALVRGLSASVRYVRVGGRNRITLRMAARGPIPEPRPRASGDTEAAGPSVA